MKLVKWIVIIALVVFGWKMLGPKIKAKFASSSSSSTSASSSAASDCVQRAAAASDAWGRGLGRFVNPPIDLTAWGSFRSDIEAQISVAQARCGCAEESCRTAKNALGDLRALISEIDSAARSGMAPPSDAVQRQETIDDVIASAAESARAGK